jgi:aldehyde dehydrogenase (NAD+)
LSSIEADLPHLSGVCAGICAWNGSHVLAAWKMAPAMAAGNTFVLKSSEKSPLALAAYGDLINEVSPS